MRKQQEEQSPRKSVCFRMMRLHSLEKVLSPVTALPDSEDVKPWT